MLVVETIARIRRGHFVQGKSIKAICRELHVSRKVVRRVLRSETTEFRYERERQPMPRLGAWRAELDRLLAANEAKPRAGAADADPGFRGVAWSGLCGRLRRGAALRTNLATRPGVGVGLCAAELCAGRGVSVRLEPRGR